MVSLIIHHKQLNAEKGASGFRRCWGFHIWWLGQRQGMEMHTLKYNFTIFYCINKTIFSPRVVGDAAVNFLVVTRSLFVTRPLFLYLQNNNNSFIIIVVIIIIIITLYSACT